MGITDRLKGAGQDLKKMGYDLKGATWGKIEQYNDYLDLETRRRYYEKIAKEEGVTVAEAMDLCVSNPTYSLGLKMASPAVLTMLKLPGGKDVFESWLTEEEKAEWMKVKDIDYKKAMKKEKKRQKKQNRIK